MKKVCLVLVTAIFLSGCNGDSRMSENYLTKQYNIESKALDLSDSGLTKVPDFSMYPNEADIFGASEINLADNDIKELDAASFTSFKNLKKVSLADNELKVIRNLDLELDNLDLSDNELEILSFAS
jgi:Leucine-rich repeat (LRR) protein